MKLKALKYMRYARKPVQPGDIFEANAADVRVLIALQRAELYVEPVRSARIAAVFKPIPSVTYSEPVVELEARVEIEDKPKRGYKRRDMQAE
jgi:hypothetical protein